MKSSSMPLTVEPDDDRITAENVIRAIRRPPSEVIVTAIGGENTSEKRRPSNSSSGWSLLKSAIGVQRRSSSIYTGGAQHNDYQRY
jgi:hypothetical protein